MLHGYSKGLPCEVFNWNLYTLVLVFYNLLNSLHQLSKGSWWSKGSCLMLHPLLFGLVLLLDAALSVFWSGAVDKYHDWWGGCAVQVAAGAVTSDSLVA
jgi:hypothetical protein